MAGIGGNLVIFQRRSQGFNPRAECSREAAIGRSASGHPERGALTGDGLTMKVSQGNKRGIDARRVTAAPRFALALLLAATAGSAGALFAPQPAMAQEAAATDNANNGEDENDPLEPMNRYFFELNKFFDTILIKPVATWYDGVVPEPGRDGVRNFLDNLRSPVILANDLLQGEWDLSLIHH